MAFKSKINCVKVKRFLQSKPKLCKCFCVLNCVIILLVTVAYVSVFGKFESVFPFKILAVKTAEEISDKNDFHSPVITNAPVVAVTVPGNKSLTMQFETVILDISNECGNGSVDCDSYEALKLVTADYPEPIQSKIRSQVLLPMKQRYHDIRTRRANSNLNVISKSEGRRAKITLASIACGDRMTLLRVMLKSAILFSQDAAHLHVIVFLDLESLMDVALSMLELKWTVQVLNWVKFKFTYELHMEAFPKGDGVDWKGMYTKCATQRLFFPSLLPHIDALIFLDADTLVVSNLTRFWEEFEKGMKGGEKLAGAAANSEDQTQGWYNDRSQIPYYGSRRLNAGVMLMNLTRMRLFDFAGRSIATHKIYHEKMYLADQDIINIIFHTFPEKVSLLDCSYNFNWIHCGTVVSPCPLSKSNGTVTSPCFCKSALRDGVRIVHGNSNTFFKYEPKYAFLPQIYRAFENFDIIRESGENLIQNLKVSMGNLRPKPCYPLTPDLLYDNALRYIKSLQG